MHKKSTCKKLLFHVECFLRKKVQRNRRRKVINRSYNKKMIRALVLAAGLAAAGAVFTGCGTQPETIDAGQAAQEVADAAAGQEGTADALGARENPDGLDQNGSKKEDQTESATEADKAAAPTAVWDASTGQLPVVGMATGQGGIEDQSFNQSAWEGLQWFGGMSGCRVFFKESLKESDLTNNIEALLDEGSNLVWATGYDSGPQMLEAAQEHPANSFAIIDYAYEDTPDNLTGVVFRDQEPSFLVGYIAANMTETGKVGFVGGVDNAVIEQFECGYRAGVAYGAKESGKEVSVESVYAGSYQDMAKGAELATGLYDGGCDIVYHAAGQTGVGVIAAAQQAGKFVIGVDKDQAFLAPENVLTSAMKYVNMAVRQISDQYASGKAIGGQTISLGLSEDAVGISENHDLYPDELYDDALQLADQIKDGTLEVPETRDQLDAFLADL